MKSQHLKWTIPICATLMGSIIGVYGIQYQLQEKPIETSHWLAMNEINYVEYNHLYQRKGLQPAEEIIEEETGNLKEEVIEDEGEKAIIESPGEEEKEAIKQPDKNDQTEKPKPEKKPPTVDRGQVERDKLQKQDLNSYILDVIKKYSGSYPYLLNNDYANYNGVTMNLYYQDQLLLKAHPSGNRASHCVGITFEVFFKAMMNRNEKLGLPKDDFNGMNWQELFDFAMGWFVADGNKAQNNAAQVIKKYGLGKVITNLEEVKAGDIIDFSRENNTGHTVIFINWIRDNGRIVGLKYWSSQGSTNGISYQEEYFNVKKADGSQYGNIMIDQLYIGRVLSVKEYR